MLALLHSLFWRLAGWLCRLRYRVRVQGGEQLQGLRGPTFVMPSHPGYIDPPLVLSHLRIQGGIRPVVFSGMYRQPALYPLMRLVNALEVPDLSEQSRGAREQTLTMIDTIVAGVERGENFLIYPSGRTRRRGREEVGAARAAAEIIQRCPQANLVLVRTQGVWGSMFSYACTGTQPRLGRCVLRAIGWMCANLLCFAPRREVTMTIEVIDRRNLPGLSREQLNPYLEDWYNRGGPEPPVYVPYHRFLGRRTYNFPDLTKTGQVDLGAIRPATIHAVNELLEEHLGRPLSDADKQLDTPLDQIGLDSLDRMDVALRIEDRFGFRADRVADTVGELWALAEGLLKSTGDGAAPVPPAWNRPPNTTKPLEVLADTLPEAFVRRALRHLGDVAVADRISGVLTYRRLLVGARLMGKRFARMQGDAIGVLLPASAAADLVFFSLQLAGKLPVLLNWTTGPANLAHAVEKLDIRHVVTSRKLIDRLGIEIPGAEYAFLEDLRSQVGKFEAAATLLASYLFPGSFLHDLPRPGVDEPAVVLFTSGSESTPKAVPLSHGNLIHNVRASLAVLNATRADAMLGFLPPFHSFGLMGTLVAPILSGFRVVHHPDPTDARGLVRSAAAYQTTLLVTTPTFLSYMLSVASPEDLRQIRIIITGAEKCPEALFARTKQLAPQATILEGYGITECSPVVSGNRPGHIKLGSVGQPVDGVEVCVVHPESRQPLPANTTGLLLVRGPCIFHGYLKYDGPDPFVQVAGKRWYVTGDLVQLDDERFIHFRGRLKRFLKVGGEMVSLPALEEPFNTLYPPTENGPQVAVEGIETPSGRWIMLFSTADIPLRQANAILAEAGFRGVMRLDEVLRVEAIPVLGTGKTDYKALRQIVVERAQSKPA
ncbi:MAG: AMP-binding protein [Planctomycetota bacterium]|nr:AMP-binding protein [Planctomycetota bacterium]